MIHTIKTVLLYAHSQHFTKICYVHIAVQLKDLGSTFPYAVEPQGQKDFNNTVQMITFHPNAAETVDVAIDIFDDAINEADEGFLIVVRRVDQAALDQSVVVLVTILDDDRT